MKQKSFNAFWGVTVLIIGAILSQSCYNKTGLLASPKTEFQSTTGPEAIKQQLVNSGVFKAPNFSFTNEYDSFNKQTNQKGLFFNGLDYHGKPTKVFCWYGVPKNLATGKKAPAVVLVHGGGGTVFPEWVKKWTDKGYIAISIGLEGQVPGEANKESTTEMKWPTTENSGPSRKGFFLDLNTEKTQDLWFYHAVADVLLAHSLIRSFPEVDTANIGITGISWGGILTNVITGIDNRFTFAIPVYGCGYLGETPNYGNQMKALSPSSKKNYLENWEPSLYIPLQKLPTLFVNGSNDCHFTLNSFTKSFNASTSEKYLYIGHEMKHGHAPGWTPNEIYAFADYVVRKKEKPIMLTLKDHSDNNASFNCTGELSEATLFYTTDTSNWVCKNYVWLKTPAVVSNDKHTVSAELPKDALYYFITGQSKNGGSYSSPMIKVAK